ncbi:MAG: type III-B CRISPR module RAMP protein Cmr4 [Deinococcota bacterium]|nr:type III-B CRISPR module RAMP protein Cmr4 [Deinococcota bacterium]
MKHIIVGMLAETFVHPGTGQNVGAIDLPVAREAATSYPFVAGSSLKGALRQAFEDKEGKEAAKAIFGEQDNAGNVLIADARLLLLPVRSLSSAYKWLTCPHLLERLQRDLKRSGDDSEFELPKVEKKTVCSQGSGRLFLEERSFEIADKPSETLVNALKQLIPNGTTAGRLNEQLAILSDDDFAWFARYGLAVQARNQLTDKKTSNNLWYEETLPPDTLMYAVLAERNGKGALQDVRKIGDYLQVGGNETVGQGWFSLRWPEAGE